MWCKQSKQSAGRSDEVAFKPDWVIVGFTVLDPPPPSLTINGGDIAMHGKREKKGSGATVREQKALRLKLRMSTAAMHVLWKQSDVRDRQCVFNSAPLQMTAIRLDNRRETKPPTLCTVHLLQWYNFQEISANKENSYQ